MCTIITSRLALPAAVSTRGRNAAGPRRARQNRYQNDAKHAEYIPNGVWPELRRLYYECAYATYPAPLAALTKFVPESQLLFGTDFSPEPIETTVDQLPTSGLSQQTLQALERANAERLFPRFKV